MIQEILKKTDVKDSFTSVFLLSHYSAAVVDSASVEVSVEASER